MAGGAKQRALDAAVLREGDPGASGAARVVPKGAQVKKLGRAVLGYESGRKRHPSRGTTLRRQRVRDAEAALVAIFGGPVGTDGGEEFFRFAAHHLPDAIAMREWSRRWTPRLSAKDVAGIIDEAVRHPRRWTAVQAGQVFRLTASERKAAGIKTIRAVGVTKREMTRARKAEDRLRKQKARAAEREARPSKAAPVPKPWEVLGVSRATYYRRRKTGETEIRPQYRTTYIVDARQSHARSPSNPPTPPSVNSDQARVLVAAVAKMRAGLRYGAPPITHLSAGPLIQIAKAARRVQFQTAAALSPLRGAINLMKIAEAIR